MKKISKFIFLLFLKLKTYKNCKIKFKNPSEKPVIIFDRLNINFIELFFKDNDFFVIDTPGPRRTVKTIYISFKILKFIFFEILNKNFFCSYWIALIKCIKPKIVITFTDNNFDFYKLAKILSSSKIKFAAIQNAYRDQSHLTQKDAKNIFIPNFFCFGQQTIDHYKSINANVGKYFKCGSLRQFFADKENKQLEKTEKLYDICLISENLPPDNDPVKSERLESLQTIAQNVKKLTLEKNLKTILILKRNSSTKRGIREINFYKKIFGKSNQIILSENINNNFKNYKIAYQSKLVIGSRSTLLLEALGFGSKILVCNYKNKYNMEKNKKKKFERMIELNPLFDTKNFFSIYENNYELFKQKAMELIDMEEDIFISRAKKIQEYMIEYDKNLTIFSKIKKQIDIWLK